jgi:hypothetical protein
MLGSVSGDNRANENAPLAALHTMFVREHNRIASQLSGMNPAWDDEKLYQVGSPLSAYLSTLFAAVKRSRTVCWVVRLCTRAEGTYRFQLQGRHESTWCYGLTAVHLIFFL